MALSSNEINTIHLRKLATPGKKYFGEDKVYIGNPNGSLKLLDNAKTVVYTTGSTNNPSVGSNLDYLNSIVQEKIGNFVLTYDSSDNLIKKESYSDTGLTNLIQTKVLDYDSLGNLQTITITGISGNAVSTFTFDSSGNLENKITT